jgi:hypothetical protein
VRKTAVSEKGTKETNNFIPLQMHNKRMVGLKNSAQNDRYVSGIFSKYMKISDK